MKSLGDVDITSPDFIQAPYDSYAVMRQQAPVYHDQKTGLYVVTAYEPLKEALNNPAVFSSEPDGDVWGIYSTHPDVVALYEREQGYRPLNTLVTNDPPHHIKYRKLVEAALGALSVARMHDSIAATVNALIERFRTHGRCDFQQEFSLRLPVAVLADLLGLGAADEPVIQRASDATVTIADARMITHEQLLAGHMVQIDTQRHFQKHIDALRKQGNESLLSHLVHARTQAGEHLTDRELHSVLQALFVGGNDTTPAGIGNSMLLLCLNPSLQEQIRGQPERIGRFVEEALRMESPVQGLYRFAKVDTELAGVKIPKGSAINVRYAAGNRDERTFPRPGTVDLERKGLRNHLAFGLGIHYCAGANLARLEMKVSVERLLARLQNIRLEKPDEPIRYVEKLAVRGFLHLPILFDPI